jgi:hypothetical protein
MSIFIDNLSKTGNFAIGLSTDSLINIVDPNEFKCSPQNISDFERPADSINGEGTLLGVKHTYELHYDLINLAHFKEIYDNTQKIYDNNGGFFMYIKVPDYVNGTTSIKRVYFNSTFDIKVIKTSEYENGAQYKLGGNSFDCLYKDITISFVEK